MCRDKWVPGIGSGNKVISPRVRVWEGDKRVSRLLNVDQGKWNTEMVRELFLPLEADLILGIPISSMAPKDELVWAMSPNGTFSVNSAYKVVVKLLKKKQNRRWTPRMLRQLQTSKFVEKHLGYEMPK